MLDSITNNYFCRPKPEWRLIPILGLISESSGPVKKTPGFQKFPLIGGDLLMTLTLNTVQQCLVSIQPVDRKGNPAEVQNIEWLTSNTDVIALEPSEDGKSCLVKSVGIPGTPTVQVSCDADLGEGVTNLVGTIAVEVVAAPAVNIVINPGAVEEQP